MADFMTPDEIQAQAKLLYEQYDKGYISAKQLADGLNDCNKGVRGFTEQMNASMKQLGTSAKRLGEDLKNGKQGSAVFNDALNSGADAAAKAAMQFGPLGVAVGAVIKVLTFFVTAANDQADALYKANQDLAKIGAAGAGGMTEIYSNLKEFGYGVGELADMSKTIGQNSVALSNFYGTVAQGAKAMAGVSKSIHSSDLQRQFMNMGYSVDDINKGIGSYLTQQSAFGMSQKRDQAELKQGAAAYLRNMSELSKLTGQSADEMASQRDEALAIDSFNAALEGMTAEQRENQLARYNYLAKFDKDAAIGYANQVSGFVGMGKQSQQLMMTTGGISNRLAKDSDMALDQFAQGFADATQSTYALRKSQALLGNSDTYLSFGKTQKIANQSNGEVLKAAKEAKNQTDAQAEGADKLTDTATKTRQAQMSSRDSMENLIQKGVLPVTEAMEGLADLIDTIVHPFGGSKRQQAKEQEAAKAAAALGGAMQGKSASDLTAAGLNIRKGGDVQKEGAPLSPKLLELAQKIQKEIPGFNYFSSFNDAWHNEKAPTSEHTKGMALDFTVGGKQPTKEEGAKISSMIKSMGASLVIDEYNNPSSKATAGHFHAAVSARDGAILSGPDSGYMPNLTLHGTEAIVPMDGRQSTGVISAQNGMPAAGTAGVQASNMAGTMMGDDNDGTEIIVTELRDLLSAIQNSNRTQKQMAS
jgi:hypothetical protein